MTPPVFDFHSLLEPLLQSLHWKGDRRHVHEAVPQNPHHDMDLQDLRDTLARLGFSSRRKRISPLKVKPSVLPILLCGPDGQSARVIDSEDELYSAPRKKAEILFFQQSLHSQSAREAMSVLRYEIARFVPHLREVMLISLIIGFISLAPILYNRFVYDHIIASGSTEGSMMLLTGVLLALSAEVGLRLMRNSRLAFFGGRIDHYVGCTVFERFLLLPPAFTERSTISAQLSRLKDFDSVREFFTGPLSTLFFEFPLLLIYLAAMGFIGGFLTLIPAVLIIAYLALMLTMNAKLRIASRIAAHAMAKRQEFLLEMITKLRQIRLAGLEKLWLERYRQISGQASLASFQSTFSAQCLEAYSYALMTLGGTATLAFGVIAVIDGDMTVGSLVATMMLIWRVIAPMQIACASMTRIRQLHSSTGQIERLLSMPPERDIQAIQASAPKLEGAVQFHRVSMKYAQDMEPAVLGVSLSIMHGQVVAIMGNNGCGKSTLLKLILGLYQPQGGSVRLDERDIRQFDPIALRQSISYAPQDADFFPGTIYENLICANPDAGDADIRSALIDACALDEILSLPDGMNTRLLAEDQVIVSGALKQRINLARAYLRKSAIYLFDEAAYSVSESDDLAFRKKIADLRGRSTVILATRREDHMLLADQLLVMNKGELTHAGPPQQVLLALKGKRS